MSLKKLGLALLAVLALSAVVAGSAMATATESNGFWYKNGTKLTTGVANALAVTCSQEGELTLTTTVGTSNTPLKLKATATTCPEAKIFNESSKAKATGRIKFTGVTVVEPAGCSVVGGEVETEPLKEQIYMESFETRALLRFAPASGEILAEPEIVGCAIAGAYPIKGTIFGEWVWGTNFSSGVNVLRFSSPINTGAGGALIFGGHSAWITGQTNAALTGGGVYKVNES